MILSKSQEGTESYGFKVFVEKMLFRIKLSCGPKVLPAYLPGVGSKLYKNCQKHLKTVWVNPFVSCSIPLKLWVKLQSLVAYILTFFNGISISDPKQQKIAVLLFFILLHSTKMKFSIKDFFSKCEQIRKKLWI